MNEKMFRATVISTKIMRTVEKDYPKLLGIEFSFENLNRVVVSPTIITVFDNNGNYYPINYSPFKNKKNLEEISDEVLTALEHLYDFLKE